MDIQKIAKTYNAETAFVILACRVFLKSASLIDLENILLNNSVNWEKIYDVSVMQRIRPVMFNVLSSIKENVDPEVFAKFRSFCIASSIRTLRREKEASRIISILNETGVRARVYKGIDFAKFAYPDISMREFTDIDIIISQSDLGAIIDIMETEGYQMSAKEFFQKFKSRYCNIYKDISFTKPDNYGGLVNLEFHYKPTKKHVDLSLSFSDLLGEGYLDPNYRLNTDNYFQLMLISNGVTDYFPNLRSLIDLALVSPGKIDAKLEIYEKLWCELSTELFGGSTTSNKASKSRASDIILRKILTKKSPRWSLPTIAYLNIIMASGLKKKTLSLFKSLSRIFTPNNETIKSANFESFFSYQVLRMAGMIKKCTLGVGKKI